MEIQTVQDRRDGGYLVNGALAVPADPANRHNRAVQEWFAAGNTPAAADPVSAPEPGKNEILLAALAAKVGVTQADLDAAKAALMAN